MQVCHGDEIQHKDNKAALPMDHTFMSEGGGMDRQTERYIPVFWMSKNDTQKLLLSILFGKESLIGDMI